MIKGALDAVKAELSEHAGHILDPGVHKAVRDAVMLGLAFGHVLLVARLTLVRSVKSVRFATQPCSKEGCVGMGCKGIRLQKVPNPRLCLHLSRCQQQKQGPFQHERGAQQEFVQALLCPPQEQWQGVSWL